jgi:hypothetical protein
MEVNKQTEENGIGAGVPGPGRPKGSVNKATAKVREAIAKMADENADNFNEWLSRVAENSPEKACDIYLKAIEYHIPKLARTEHVGDPNQPVILNINTGI